MIPQTKVQNNRSEFFGICYAIAGILCFSLLEVCSKPFKGHIAPLALTSIRFFTGGIIMLPFGFSKSYKLGLFKPKNLIKCLLLASLGLNLAMGLLQISINYIPAGVVATIIAAVPVFVPFFAWLIKKHRPEKKHLVSIFLGIIGISIISYEGFKGLQYNMTGILLTLCAAAAFALYSVLGADFLKKYGPLGTLGTGAIWVGLTFSPFAFKSLIELNKLGNTNFLTQNWPRIAVLGLIVSGVGYLFYFKGLELLGPARGASFFFLKPGVAACLSYIYLAEKFTSIEILGMLIVSAAVLFTGLKSTTKAVSTDR